MCASEHDTGEQRQPPQPQALSPPSSRTPRRSSLLLTFRAPRRPQPDGVPLPGKDPLPASEPLPPSASLSATQPLTASEPQTASERTPGDDPPPQARQARASGNPSAGMYATRLLDGSLIVIGAALFLCALATLTSTWAWSWHAGSGRIFSLSHMAGICTSAMGELAQGASGNVASHCLWVDGTWTEAVVLTGGGFILAVIGIARIVGRLRRSA